MDAAHFDLHGAAERGERAPAGGILLVTDPLRRAAHEALLEVLVGAGYAVLAVEIAHQASDRALLRELDLALGRLADRTALPDERLAVLGLGAGGTAAFLFGCHSARVAAVALFDGPLRYSGLDAEHPIQPLELALNLTAPLFAVYARAGDAVADAQVLEERLGAFMKSASIHVVAGDDAGSAPQAHTLALAFLADAFDGE